MATAATTTIFEAVRDEVAGLAAELEKRAEKGTPRREFVNALLRDMYVVLNDKNELIRHGAPGG